MITLDSLTLPDNCLWQDEFAFSRVRAAAKLTIQGKPIIQAQASQLNALRPITLGSEMAWIDRADLETLRSWADEAGKQMLLTLHDGRSFQVVFRHWDSPAIDAAQGFPTADPEDTDPYQLNAVKLAVVT